MSMLALAFALLTFEDQPPIDRSAPWDLVALALSVLGCGMAFYGASALEAGSALGAVPLALLVAGAALLVALVVHQYRARHPLMPVRQLATTYPVVGILVAMSASAASFGLIELVLEELRTSGQPTRTALVFLPLFGAAVATAGLFGLLFRTRFTPLLAFAGMAMLVAAAAVVALGGRGTAVVALATWLTGLGVGASVSPALFMAGFSLRSSQVQRVFALVELLRGVMAFLVSPILLYLVAALAVTRKVGIVDASWICLGMAAAGGSAAGVVFLLGTRHLQAPAGG